jgi:hypothetical protein
MSINQKCLAVTSKPAAIVAQTVGSGAVFSLLCIIFLGKPQQISG